jgi:hypothetical protein
MAVSESYQFKWGILQKEEATGNGSTPYNPVGVHVRRWTAGYTFCT